MTVESLRPLVRDTAALRASLEQQLEQADKLLGTLVAGRITSGPDTRDDPQPSAPLAVRAAPR